MRQQSLAKITAEETRKRHYEMRALLFINGNGQAQRLPMKDRLILRDYMKEQYRKYCIRRELSGLYCWTYKYWRRRIYGQMKARFISRDTPRRVKEFFGENSGTAEVPELRQEAGM